ncbi:MAG: TIGR03960 family B12-binding radical SAM protein [Anaerolineales bacterium]|uniref:TIGR03960 family B12-binding radical SAM protein n=1 Tax=Candidatus Villigracilis affinis TaxID=3140682 RepID=UPI001D9DD5E4|nr:TIGR03960 family B12-binding radical SAM protein [Anaerolineales bacterium]MBK9601665.1 TIGR03960 family B12-binding radical SAM protein [Anaerolineales bacterium]MBL0345096.1 TIGR03960 family B12-binding radical SAM protein [Anaerolineales bacterium]
MMKPEQIEIKLDRILLKVQKPGRYVGGELNITVKDWETARTKVALVFPDIYDIGVSNVGLKILYDQINQREDALAERAYAPWVDMEALMREHGIPLYTLESKQPLACFDLIGFTLPYETLYTNTLNILDLAGIPVRSSERDESHPIIIAGGHAATNPEPMHAFIDAFVIGEGEEVIHDVVNAIQKFKSAPNYKRDELLVALAQISGVYVPKFYETTYLEDGTVANTLPTIPEAPKLVNKRIVAKLLPPPVKFIVPNVEVIHNRVSVEIMRGCTRGCRFCQAGMITRPVRERSVQEVVDAADAAVRSTGFEELALMSLSSSDYTYINELVDAISKRFEGRKLSVNLPSLRIESVSVDLMDKLKQHRTGGFTLAPEAASERMRRIINKFIPDEEILNTTRDIYSRGWTTIKLYFMIGHPSETLEDVQAIVDLCRRVIDEGRKVAGWKVKLHAGVSTFVPKPQTPFQWVACDTRENILEKQALLKRQLLKDKSIKLSWTKPEDSLLEAWLSRGDRRMSEVIYTAWKNGAKFDAWDEAKKQEAWLPAFEEHGLDPAFYTHRQRRTDEVFPWEHITAAVRKNFLFQDFRQSLEGQIRVDCRLNCFACGILPTFANLRRENPGEGWKCPDVKSPVSKVNIELPVMGD